MSARIMKFIALSLLLLVAPATATAEPLSAFEVVSPPNSDGLTLELSWEGEPDRAIDMRVVRRKVGDEYWELVGEPMLPGTQEYEDRLPEGGEWEYRIIGTFIQSVSAPAEEADEESKRDWVQTIVQDAAGRRGATEIVSATPRGALMNTNPGHLTLLFLVASVGGLMLYYTRKAQRGEEIYIRKMPGIDAIEEGIGRATEMGKPVLYIPGIDDLQDIQTIASMLILGQVSKTVAEYQSDLIVSCCIPIVREVADEVVRAGFFQAGHPDAFDPTAVRFISSEQFAFCAGTNGIIHREKPATNIYFGRFFAESLILAETGYVNRSIQIAGTAEATQLPFFVAACDYTLIGEELFAVSAYLSRDPRLVSSLKASDIIKVACVAAMLIGTLLASIGSDLFVNLFTIAG